MCFCKTQDTFEEEGNESLGYVHCGKRRGEQIAAMRSANENLAFKYTDASFSFTHAATETHFSDVFKITLRSCRETQLFLELVCEYCCFWSRFQTEILPVK